MLEFLRRTFEAKRTTLLQLLAVLAVAAVLVGISGVWSGDPSAEIVEPAAAAPSLRAVRITLTGEQVTSADVTIRVGSDTSQRTVDVPMTDTFDVPPGTFVYLSAQMSSEVGKLDCELVSNAKQIAVSSSSVSYGIVTCSGTA